MLQGTPCGVLNATGFRNRLSNDTPTVAPGPHTSTMVRLNCGDVSSAAWPVLNTRLNLALAIEDKWVGKALRFTVKGPSR